MNPIPSEALQVEEETATEDMEEEQVIPRQEKRHLPTNVKMRWSDEELKIVGNLDKEQPLKKVYDQYILQCIECIEKRIPHRSYKCLQRKLLRL